MTSSMTRSASEAFTLTHARYVGAKIGADLRLLANFYGRPPLTDIDAYVEEAAVLLRDGYLDTVDFGFRLQDANAWRLRLRYTATLGGRLVDDRPGGFPATISVAGLPFCSFLRYSTKFLFLPTTEQNAITAPLPIQRTTGTEPTVTSGASTSGHGYSRNGAGVSRGVYVAN